MSRRIRTLLIADSTGLTLSTTGVHPRKVIKVAANGINESPATVSANTRLVCELDRSGRINVFVERSPDAGASARNPKDPATLPNGATAEA